MIFGVARAFALTFKNARAVELFEPPSSIIKVFNDGDGNTKGKKAAREATILPRLNRLKQFLGPNNQTFFFCGRLLSKPGNLNKNAKQEQLKRMACHMMSLDHINKPQNSNSHIIQFNEIPRSHQKNPKKSYSIAVTCTISNQLFACMYIQICYSNRQICRKSIRADVAVYLAADTPPSFS